MAQSQLGFNAKCRDLDALAASNQKRRYVLQRVLPDALRHQKEEGRRPSLGKQSIHRGDRAQAPPRFREHDVTITERRVRNTRHQTSQEENTKYPILLSINWKCSEF